VGPDDDLLLDKFLLEPFPQRAPVVRLELLRHDLDHGDGVPFGLAAAAPQAPTRRPDEAGGAAELLGQLVK
jgi:hypothetical protein